MRFDLLFGMKIKNCFSKKIFQRILQGTNIFWKFRWINIFSTNHFNMINVIIYDFHDNCDLCYVDFKFSEMHANLRILFKMFLRKNEMISFNKSQTIKKDFVFTFLIFYRIFCEGCVVCTGHEICLQLYSKRVTSK